MITTWSSGIADYNMNEDILVRLRGKISPHPWWHARSRLTLALLRKFGVTPPARVLDVGCGWGTTLAALERAGYTAVGLDVSRSALELLDRENPSRVLVEADLEQPLHSPERFDAALALDVIEHLDDDRRALSSIASLLRPGGVVVVSVPARPDLFSEFDAVQGHRRRYLPDRLREAFRGTGLELATTFYWGGWMVPLMKARRTAKQPPEGESAVNVYERHLELPGRPVRDLLSLMFLIDHPVSLAGLNPTGTSLIAIAQRV
jgi:SAM-dependent methyltransferase